MGAVVDTARDRVKVCRREENPFVPAPGVEGGDGRRLAADEGTGGVTVASWQGGCGSGVCFLLARAEGTQE